MLWTTIKNVNNNKQQHKCTHFWPNKTTGNRQFNLTKRYNRMIVKNIFLHLCVCVLGPQRCGLACLIYVFSIWIVVGFLVGATIVCHVCDHLFVFFLLMFISWFILNRFQNENAMHTLCSTNIHYTQYTYSTVQHSTKNISHFPSFGCNIKTTKFTPFAVCSYFWWKLYKV